MLCIKLSGVIQSYQNAEELSQAVHDQKDRREARENALPVHVQSMPIRPTPARSERRHDVHAKGALFCFRICLHQKISQ